METDTGIQHVAPMSGETAILFGAICDAAFVSVRCVCGASFRIAPYDTPEAIDRFIWFLRDHKQHEGE